MIAIDAAHIQALAVSEHRQMHFGDYGVASVGVHNSYQCVDIACFIYMSLADAAFAEAESALAQTLYFLHHPQMFMLQLLGAENG